MVLSVRPNESESSSENMGINLRDLLAKRDLAEQQIKDLTAQIDALDVLIKIERGDTSLPVSIMREAANQLEKEQASKRGMMIEIVKLMGRAKPKEVLEALLARRIKVDAHYIHNELSALYKSKQLGREKGQYFLLEKQDDKKEKNGLQRR